MSQTRHSPYDGYPVPSVDTAGLIERLDATAIDPPTIDPAELSALLWDMVRVSPSYDAEMTLDWIGMLDRPCPVFACFDGTVWEFLDAGEAKAKGRATWRCT